MILRNPQNRSALMGCYQNDLRNGQFGSYYSYADGRIFKKSNYFKKFPDALRIIIYEDDVEPCNALSSRAGNKKISAIYFKIQNLPKEFNASTKSVFPLIYAKSADSKVHGYNKILAPLVEDLKRLENGVTVFVGDETITIRGTVIVVAGDTLAMHELLGLLGPSANFFCRECTITRNKFLEDPYVNQYPLRDRQWYETNLQRLQTKEVSSKECGLKPGGCILNDLEQFHLTDNHSFDVMHDLAEGVIPVTLQLVLAQYYRNKNLGFSIDFINHRLKTFNYGYRDRKNKPSANITAPMLLQPTKHRMRQTASQYLLLLQAFPFLFMHKVSKDCEYMALISILINITRIAFSSTVPDYLLAELEISIKMFHNMFFKLFQSRPNKLHHLYHYPECIKEIGPLQQYDCRIFEQKNKSIKTQMNTARNYKNVCLSLAKRQIFAQAVTIAEKPFKENTSYQSGSTVLVEDTLSAPLLNYGIMGIVVFVQKR